MSIRRMASPKRVVLLACGSYNPVTNMHLRMFELARDSLTRTGKYHVVKGIVSPVSDGYGKKDLQPAKHRCAMLRLALKAADWIKLDTWECEQAQWSPTARVLTHFRQQLDQECNNHVRPTPNKRRKKDSNKNEDEVDHASPQIMVNDRDHPIELKLLCGADLLESFGTPGLWADEDIEHIVNKHGLVCISRAGYDPRKFIYESDVLTKYQENITIITEWIPNEISSTKIRRALRRGESVKYLVQDTVIEYIRDHQLYGVPDNKYINHMMPSPNADSGLEVEDDRMSTSSEVLTVHILTSNTPERLGQPKSPSPHSPHSGGFRPVGSSARSSPTSSKSSRGPTPCMTDIGSLVRRVKNYNLRVFQPWKIHAQK